MGKKRQKLKKIPKAKPQKENSGNKTSIRKTEDKKAQIIEKINNNQRNKKIAVSFKKLNRIFSLEDINNFSLEQLKINCSNFDLNSKLNFKLLSKLKEKNIDEYNIYITKYKYTLEYEDAKNLDCFNDKEKDIIKECYKNFNIEIKEIKSLSKLKLFNFLFYIINLKLDDKNRFDVDLIKLSKEIKEKILSYGSETDLIFKIPNNYGNYELKYYTYLDLFINYFYKKIEPKINDDKINNDEASESQENEIYFNWDEKIYGKKEQIDTKEFENNRNELSKLIFGNINNENNIKMEIEKKDENEKDNIINNINDEYTITNNLIYFFKKHTVKLKNYKDEIFYLFREENDEKIINQIEFIYYSLLFTNECTYTLYGIYPYCLCNNPSMKNENYYLSFKAATKKETRDSIKTDELVFYNLNDDFEKRKDNPFCYNAQYYKYPILLYKNIFQLNQNTFKLFRKFLKEIYQSKLLEEIFYLTPEFNDFKYPLLDDEILDEMLDNTIFLPYDHQTLHGYTQKQFTKIYVSTKLLKEDYFKNDISKIIIELGFFLNTLIHEQFKHYIKGLLFYNSFRFKENRRLYSDISGYEKEKAFMDNIRKKYSENKNEKFKQVIDGGNRAEIYLYGNVLYKLYLEGALKMFDKTTWDLPVYKHLELFKEDNRVLSEDKKRKIDDIQKDLNMADFIKDIIFQFDKFYKGDGQLELNYLEYGSEKPNDNLMFIDENNEVFLDYSTYIETSKITIPDTETDKNVLNKFEQ